jgi:gliding motility-associated-like protein
LSGVGPHYITFCKPGNNSNEYTISAVPNVIASNDITLNNGCSGLIGVTGMQESTVTWSSIYPGPTGAYNSYLSCTAGCDTVTVTASAGAPPYVDYSVCGITIDGCSNVPYCDTVRVYFNPTLVTTIVPVNPVLCYGNPGLTITSNTTGGSPPYTYLWSTGATTQSIFVGPGTYTVTVHDTSNCPPATATVTVTTYTAAITANAGTNQMVCASNPSVTLSGSVTGVTTGVWSGGTGTFSPSNTSLNATYTPSATDIANGSVTLVLTTTNNGPCPPGTDSMTITINTFNATIDPVFSNVTCNSFNDGWASVNLAGGSPPFTFSWSTNPIQTTQTAINLGPGTYTCTITDANGCSATVSVTITQPPAITAVPSQVNVTCNGSCNGTATVVASGGSGNYTYLWSPTGQTTATATGLCAASYTCVISSPSGCNLAQTFTITQPPPITATQSQVNVTCNGSCNGSATVVPSGGTGNYTYLWSPTGQTTATATGLCATSYTCTISSPSGCTITQTFTITQPPTITATQSQVNVTCNGSCNGSATVVPSGGTGNYTYLWSPTGQTTATATGLCATSYTCTISSPVGCTTTQTFAITQPPAITATQSQVNVTCNANCNGSATVVPSGGTGIYSYLWSPTGQTAATATGLCAGSYTCAISSPVGCTTTQTFTITEPSPLILNTGGFPASCFGACDGQAVVLPSGGNGNYTFLWQPGNISSAAATNLCQGIYSVTVTDQYGCTATDTAHVGQPSQISIVTSSSPSYCNHASGSATATASGGIGGYTYLWQPTNQTTNPAVNLLPGSYSVTVTDINGCHNTASVNVSNTPGETGLITNVTPPLCTNSCNGSTTVSVSGGFPSYQYSWSTSPVQTGATATNLCAGTYSVIISDAQSCIDTVTVQIIAPPQLTLTPGTGTTICIGQTVTLTATSSGGTPSYSYTWSPSGPTVSPTNNTTYSVYVTDANGCQTAPQPITVQVHPPLSVTLTGNQLACMNVNSTLVASASGGNGGPYTYTWQPGNYTGGSNYIIHPSSTTTYTVSVTDNCTSPVATATFTVTVPPLPVVSFTIDDTSGCGHVCSNFINTTPNTQSTFWTFSDGFTSTLPTVNHCFQPGAFAATLIVTDNNGCKDTLTLQNAVTVHNNPVASFTLGPQPTTILEPNICFTDNSTNDVVTWYWNFDDPNDQTTGTTQNVCHSYSDTGHYCASLIVTNQYGCWSTAMNCLIIQPYFSLYVPNAFTPNEDGLNDVFLPVGNDVDPDNYELTIYDRWGNLIFKTTTWGEGWNGVGKDGTKIAQIDAYVWKINLKDHAGQRHSLIGHVSLIK